MAQPKASRPEMPAAYGIADAKSGKGLLPWKWATGRLIKNRNYWLSTSRPEGRPHVMPVWGVWLDNIFYFSTSSKSRKARNLKANPSCVLTTDNAQEAVIVEGRARKVSNIQEVKRVDRAYYRKYKWHADPDDGPFYAIRPSVAFGLIESDDFTATATRWKFGSREVFAHG